MSRHQQVEIRICPYCLRMVMTGQATKNIGADVYHTNCGFKVLKKKGGE